MRPPARRWRILAAFATCFALSEGDAFADARSQTVVRNALPALRQAVSGLRVGSALRIEDVRLDGVARPDGFELERVDVFSPDTRLNAFTKDGPIEIARPNVVYLRGFVESDVSSVVVLTVPPTGGPTGIVSTTGGTWVVAGKGELLLTRRIDFGREFAGRSSLCAGVTPYKEQPNPQIPAASRGLAAAVPG